MATTAQTQEIIKLYLAYFNRAPEFSGLQYHIAQFDAAITIGKTEAQALAERSENFNFSSQQTEGYNNLSNADFIKTVYYNVQGRQAADGTNPAISSEVVTQSEIDYWLGELTAGRQTRDSLVNTFLTATKEQAENGTPEQKAGLVDTVNWTNNRIAVSEEFSKSLYSNGKGATEGKAAVAAVTPDAASVQTALASVTSSQALTSTDGDTLTGAGASDTFTGTVSLLASGTTLHVKDKIDGGAGNDTLDIALNGNFAGFSSEGYVKNVETIKLTNAVSLTQNTFAATNVTGVTEYQLNGAVGVTDLLSIPTKIVVNDRASAALTIGFAADAAATATTPAIVNPTKGTADSLNIELNKVGTVASATGVTPVVAEAAVAITATGIETLNVAATGDNVVSFTTADNLVLSGAGSVKVNAVATGLKKFDASAAEGKIVANLAAVTGGVLASVSGGKADDTITISTAGTAANATINGGEGKDTLVISGGAKTVEYALSNVETIEVGALTGNLSYSAKNTTGVEKIVVAGTSGVNNAVFANLGDAAIAVDLKGGAATGTVSLDQTGATAVNVLKTDDATKTSAANLTLSKSSAVNVTVAADTTYTGTVTASKAATVDLAIKGTATAATVSAAEATKVVISAVDNASTLTLTAAKATELDVTASKSLALTSTLTELKTLKVSTADSFSSTNALGKLETATLSGAGSVTLGDITAASTGVTIDGTALSGDLTVGDIKSASTVTFKGTYLGVNQDDAGAGTAVKIEGTGTSLTADLTGGLNADQFAITGAGTTASYVVKGDLGEGSDSVTVTSTAAATVASVKADVSGLVNVETVTVSLNAGTTVASTTKTFTAEITGGAAAETVTVASTGETTGLVVKGDLGGGNDTVNVNAVAIKAGATIDVASLVAENINITLAVGAQAETIIVGNGIAGTTAAVSVAEFTKANDKIDFKAIYGVGAAGNFSVGTAVADYAAAKVAADAAFAANTTTTYYAVEVGTDTYVFGAAGASTTAEHVVKLVDVTGIVAGDFAIIA